MEFFCKCNKTLSIVECWTWRENVSILQQIRCLWAATVRKREFSELGYKKRTAVECYISRENITYFLQ